MSIAKVLLRVGRGWLGLALLLAAMVAAPQTGRGQADDPNPPAETVRLIFIHHSTGENWLMDDYGNLGRELGENNYFVSDTNYGWGPEGIGDRTDILNWPEWFRSANTPRYMQALFNESGQNAWYSRWLSDPGGENQIVMFKSCFPNSMLEGNPDDPPAPGDGLTVANAKFIYNDLLNYFVTRPDKLFIVITAPPVQDPTYAENARAFNLWLVQDWLEENAYPLNNVAVFDFYNVLTHPDNHHRYHNGQIEYITSHGDNTLYYDSDGDDHPNVEGSQKATAEFVPLLNVFYHRWASGTAGQAPMPPTAAPAEVPIIVPAPVAAGSSQVDDFESGTPVNSEGWRAYWDEATPTSIACGAESGLAAQGNAALHIRFEIAANSWGTCALFYDRSLSWQTSQGIGFWLRASDPALIVDVTLYGGTPEETTTYLFALETTPEMAEDWGYVELRWDDFRRAEWEAEAGTPFDPSQVTGMAFGFSTYPDAPNRGEIWVDEIRLLGEMPSEPAETEAALPISPAVEAGSEPPSAEEQAGPTEKTPPQSETGGGRRLCPGSAAVGLGAAAMVGLRLRRRKGKEGG